MLQRGLVPALVYGGRVLALTVMAGCASVADSNISTCTQWCEDYKRICHATGEDCATICGAEQNVAEMTGCTAVYDDYIACETRHPAETACGAAPCNDTSVYPCERSYCMPHGEPIGCF